MRIISPKSSFSRRAIGDALKQRNIHTVAYLHTDHFEPWRLVPGRDDDMGRSVQDVEHYLALTGRIETARRSSLFYKSNVNYIVSADRALYRADPYDLLGFVPRGDRDRQIGAGMIAPIVGQSSHELQIHIHHEYITYNDTERDRDAFAYLQTPRGRVFDAARLELNVQLSLDTLREDANFIPSRWFFIHGHWALNASDPHECTVVREIEILMRNGCLGDFTQPSGRPHVDSRIDVPYLVEPVAAAKGYDTPAAGPLPAEGAASSAADRFFIWASATTHNLCSIDTYSPFVQRRMETPQETARLHARDGVVIDGVLYVKTHCHSMSAAYWKHGGDRPIPQADPAIQAELGMLFDAAADIGAGVLFLTASEAYDRILSAPAPAAFSLTDRYDLRTGSALERIGVDVAYKDADGRTVTPPPLGPKKNALPEAAPANISPPSDSAFLDLNGHPKVAVAYVVPLGCPVANAGVWGEPPLLHSVAVLSNAMKREDVRRIDTTASEIALGRFVKLGGEQSGVTGFYAARAERGVLLQPSEVLSAEFLRLHLPQTRYVYEIGCGLGVLAALLSTRGLDATGIERNSVRFATANVIAEALQREASEGAGSLTLLRGSFPDKVPKLRIRPGSVALLTNLIGSATLAQQQAFINGLAPFDAVLIDMQRFHLRRTTEAQFAELSMMFTSTGFDQGRLAFDLQADGRYMLFQRLKTRRRSGYHGLIEKLGLARAAQPAINPLVR